MPGHRPTPRRRRQTRDLCTSSGCAPATGAAAGCATAQPADVGQCQRQSLLSLSPPPGRPGRRAARAAGARRCHPAGARRPQSGGGYVVQVFAQKTEADAQASTAPSRASLAMCWGQPPAGREKGRYPRKGGVLSRFCRPLRLPGRGLPDVHQPEICWRAVFRPKELTAVSLTTARRRGLIGLMSAASFITAIAGLELTTPSAPLCALSGVGLHPVQAQCRQPKPRSQELVAEMRSLLSGSPTRRS